MQLGPLEEPSCFSRWTTIDRAGRNLERRGAAAPWSVTVKVGIR